MTCSAIKAGKQALIQLAEYGNPVTIFLKKNLKKTPQSIALHRSSRMRMLVLLGRPAMHDNPGVPGTFALACSAVLQNAGLLLAEPSKTLVAKPSVKA
jgi:hypothetical protein